MPEEKNNSQDKEYSPQVNQQPNSEQSAEKEQVQLTDAESQLIRITELESTIVQLKDQLLRKAAEFDNYKKRTENDMSDRIKFANEDLLFELLPVLDDFERSLKMSRERNPALKDEVFYRGIDLMYQKLIKILESQGMKHYEVLGKPFDAYYHDALMQISKEGVPPHTIIEEVEKGYMLHGKVLRHAKVIVAEDNVTDSSKNDESQEAGTSQPDTQEK